MPVVIAINTIAVEATRPVRVFFMSGSSLLWRPRQSAAANDHCLNLDLDFQLH
jgi:hypothetical protein